MIRVDNVSHIIDYGQDGIYVSAGTKAYLALSRQFKSSLPKPYSDCDDLSINHFNSNLYNLIKQSKYDYTQQFCLSQCLQELVIKTCNCSDSVDFAVLRNVSSCSSTLQVDCALYKAYYEVYFQTDYIENVCIPQCPLECNSSKITYKLSSNQLMPNIYMTLLQAKPNLKSDFINRSLEDENVILKSVVKLVIFYDSLSYTISEETPQIDIVSLISQIGGNLGLFMGVCLFSLGEILITLIELILHKFSVHKKVNTKDGRLVKNLTR